jgi:2-methylisocitrate lyase-like PEP mutase family enzyme
MPLDRATVTERRRTFRALHAGPAILVMPNAWDVASARIYEEAGFPAVATSSAGLANSLGFRDGNELDVDLHLATLERIVRALGVPLSADVESGYAVDTTALAAFIARLAATGVAGYNLEDTVAERDLFSLDEAAARVRAARAAAPDLFLNARTDIYLGAFGPESTRFDATVKRLRAYADAGADGLFVPGVADAETIARIAAAVQLPLNVLAGPKTPDAPALQALGVRRVSVGSWPMRRTLGVLREIARELREAGTFSFTRDPLVTYAEANALVAPRQKPKGSRRGR